ncbi:MAG: class II aldolase/adducin family protein [Actinomycetota bacterium]
MKLAIDIIATAQAMNASGINVGTAGNVSARTKTGMLITPSSTDYLQLTPDDIVAMDFDTTWFATNNLRPSSEWRLHLDILNRRPDVNAIVHTHSTHATALSTHGRGIPAFHYMVAVAGGHDIACAPYATFGSQALSDHVADALEGRLACLMAHHGVVAVGSDLSSALQLAIQVEDLAHQYVAAHALGEPPLLSRAEMDVVAAKMARSGYGSSPGDDDDDQAATVLHLDR